jgi:phospholipase C
MRPILRKSWPAAALGAAGLAAAFVLIPGGHPAAPATKLAASAIPQYAHVVVVMEENHS